MKASIVMLCLLLLSGCMHDQLRTIPKWQDSMSDGCSHVPDISPDVRACCVIHDAGYYRGGSIKDKARVDAAFFSCLWIIAPEIAPIYFAGVTAFGGPEWREPGVSWAFGDSYFKYSDEPATEK